jgi:predicted membrane-bound spermidine synthase
MKKVVRYYFGIFFISFSTLLFELSLTRVFSVTLWYHFGFLIISTALLGFGVSGILLSIWRKFREHYDLDKTLGWISLCLTFSIIVCFWLLQKIPFDPFSLYGDKMQLLYMPLTYIVVSVPFFFAGLALSLLFTRFPSNIHSLYAFDLAGAAMGCRAIIFTISYFGGGGSVLFAGPFAAIAAILFFGKYSRPMSVFSFLLLIASLIISFNADQFVPLHITSNKRSSASKTKPVFTKWNTFSRIDLYVDESHFDSIKKSPTFVIDEGTAATGLDFDMKPDIKTVLSKFPGDSLYGSCLAYLNKKNPDVLIIGSGCGTEVVDALHHGVQKVTAVEINPIINDVVLHNPYWSDLFHQPQVRLITGEGRNFVRSTKEKYDAIISVHTISNAAIASGALSLSENYVLTKEAFKDYYEHLKDGGMIYFTRPEFQLPRLFTTGREVLEEKGVADPSLHFFAFTYPETSFMGATGRKSFFSIFVMSKSSLTRKQVTEMNAFIELTKDPSPIILYDPFRNNENIYDSVLTVRNLTGLYGNYPFELAPATDNQPFFNHHTRWSSLGLRSFKDIFSQKKMGRMALEDKPIAEVSLIVLLAQVIIISSLVILLPLWRFSKIGLPAKNIFPFLFYFSGLGCGFIMIEMVMIQLFSLLLGEPVYTFAIVLSALLLFTGIGAFISGKYRMYPLRTLRNSIISLSVLLLVASFFLPGLLRVAIAFSMPARVILAIFLIMPLGILLGMPFPSGIDLISKQAPSLIPWAWGVNGFFTVIGSVMAIMLAMTIGFQGALWIAIAIYLISLLLITRIRYYPLTGRVGAVANP